MGLTLAIRFDTVDRIPTAIRRQPNGKAQMIAEKLPGTVQATSE